MSALDIPIIMPKGCNDPRILAETGIAEIGSYWSEMQQTVVENSIRIGKLLVKVKEDCQKAGIPFAAIFEGARHPDPGIRRLPFSQNTGNRFMHIARNPALLNCAHVQNLPDDRFALYELSRLEPGTLTRLIGEGAVQRDMDREQVVEVVKKHRLPFYRKGNPKKLADTVPKPAALAGQDKVKAEADKKLAADLYTLAKAAKDALENLCLNSKNAEDAKRRLRAALNDPWISLGVGVKETVQDGQARRTHIRNIFPGMNPEGVSEGRYGRVETLIEVKVHPGNGAGETPPEADAPSLTKKDQKALDKALAKLQAEFEQSVAAEVEKRLADARERKLQAAQHQVRSAQEREDVWKARVDSCKPFLHLFKGSWRTVASSIHPDRPERTKEQLEKASAAMNKLKSAFERIALDKWGAA